MSSQPSNNQATTKQASSIQASNNQATSKQHSSKQQSNNKQAAIKKKDAYISTKCKSGTYTKDNPQLHTRAHTHPNERYTRR
eukprot:Seg7115.3 transcript_id=Seg7115.3/GoldUCD/mRNA.D3Y31 product="hypothetical protein" pseudo=true protein_id=Seg7115.3/GoldUCD/D3Y31